MNFIRLLLTNSSVLLAPASGFLVVLILTQESTLPEDTFFFFALGVVGFMSLMDGGLPYKQLGQMTERRFARVMRSLTINWSWCIAPMAGTLVALTILTDFANDHPWKSTAILVFLALVAGSCRLFADSARILGLQTSQRSRINALSSLINVLRAVLAWIYVNSVPFIYIHTALCLIEMYIYLAVLRGPTPRGMALYRPTFQRRARIFRDYVVANIGYLLGSSVDRIIAFYFVGSTTYKGIILQSAFYNMAILPHKMVEHEVMFSRADGKPRNSWSLLMCAVGATCLGTALSLQANRNAQPASLSVLLLVSGALWLAATLIYNRQWAVALRGRATTNLANGTRIAGLAAVVGAIVLSGMYTQWILVGALAYALTNVMFVARDRSAMHGMTLAVASSFLATSLFAITAGFLLVWSLQLFYR